MKKAWGWWYRQTIVFQKGVSLKWRQSTKNRVTVFLCAWVCETTFKSSTQIHRSSISFTGLHVTRLLSSVAVVCLILLWLTFNICPCYLQPPFTWRITHSVAITTRPVNRTIVACDVISASCLQATHTHTHTHTHTQLKRNIQKLTHPNSLRVFLFPSNHLIIFVPSVWD